MHHIKQKIENNLTLDNDVLNRRAILSGIVLIVAILGTNMKDLLLIIKENALAKEDALYFFPFVNSKAGQRLILNNLIPLGVFIGIFFGFLLGYFLVFIYLWFRNLISSILHNKKLGCLFSSNKLLKDSSKFGLVEIKSELTSLKSVIIRSIIAGFLTMSILFILLDNDYFASFWWKNVEDFNDAVLTQTFGKYSEPFALPWLWIAVAIIMTLLISSWTILDSGLISVKKEKNFHEYRRVERVGKIFDRYIKGFLGVSLLINWIIWIGKFNIGVIVLPINSTLYLFFFIVILDYFKPFSSNLVRNATKKVFPDIKLMSINIKEKKLSEIKDQPQN